MLGVSLAFLAFYIVVVTLHFSTSIKLTSTPAVISVFSSFSVFSCLLLPIIEESYVAGALLSMLIIAAAVPIIVYQIRSCGKNSHTAYQSLKSVRDILIGGTICNGIMILNTIIPAILLFLLKSMSLTDIIPDDPLSLIALPFFLLADLLILDKTLALGAGICFGFTLNIVNTLLVFSSTKILYAPSDRRNLYRFLSFFPVINFSIIIIFLIKTIRLSGKQKSQNT